MTVQFVLWMRTISLCLPSHCIHKWREDEVEHLSAGQDAHFEFRVLISGAAPLGVQGCGFAHASMIPSDAFEALTEIAALSRRSCLTERNRTLHKVVKVRTRAGRPFASAAEFRRCVARLR